MRALRYTTEGHSAIEASFSGISGISGHLIESNEAICGVVREGNA
jgi:hypothetical protein